MDHRREGDAVGGEKGVNERSAERTDQTLLPRQHDKLIARRRNEVIVSQNRELAAEQGKRFRVIDLIMVVGTEAWQGAAEFDLDNARRAKRLIGTGCDSRAIAGREHAEGKRTHKFAAAFDVRLGAKHQRLAGRADRQTMIDHVAGVDTGLKRFIGADVDIGGNNRRTGELYTQGR